MIKKSFYVLILFILFGCQQEKYEWNPIFEDTNFDYFNTNIEQSLLLINDAYTEASKNREESLKQKLYQAKSKLLEIKDYYLPLTTVRQKIYDAERYLKLNQIKKTEKLLNESKSIITSLDMTTKNKTFDKVILDLTSMLNEVITSLDEDSKLNAYNKIKTLGDQVNLMLYRGELVLSGIEFDK